MNQENSVQEETLENHSEIFSYAYTDASADLLCRGEQDRKER
jgi:hypothetical protein